MDDRDPLVAEIEQARRGRRVLVAGVAIGIVLAVVVLMTLAVWRWASS